MGKPRTEGYYTRASVMTGVQSLAQELGHELAPMLERHGLSAGMLSTPDLPISYLAWCQVLEACALEWDCPDFGLRLGTMQNLNILGAVGLVARLPNTVGEALKELEHSLPMHSHAYSAYLDTSEAVRANRVSLVYAPKVVAGTGRQMAELSMGVARNTLAAITGQENPPLLGVSFKHAVPRSNRLAQRIFACPISYGDSCNALRFASPLLQLPTSIKDLALAPVVRQYLARAGSPSEADIVELTSLVIERLLVTHCCQMEDVARCLQLPARTLQRRLHDKGANYAELFDQQRKKLGLELVTRQEMPLAQIADTLGFSDQSSFNQAFKRWTERSPTQFRKDAAT